MDIYREQLLDHYHHPRGYGLQVSADKQAEEYSEVCGDRIVVQLAMKKGIIFAMHFEGHSCAISTACASLISEVLPGMDEVAIMQMDIHDIESLLGFSLSPARVGCGLLALRAVQKALQL